MAALVRSLVVVRGGEAMAPRELLPLRIPRGPESEEDSPAAYSDDLDPFERGPEITEIR
jgi:hypothetical protein